MTIEIEEYNFGQYFDDIEDHIEMLELEASTYDGSEYADDLQERITNLKDCYTNGDLWVDKEITTEPNAWKNLETYTEEEAKVAYNEWEMI